MCAASPIFARAWDLRQWISSPAITAPTNARQNPIPGLGGAAGPTSTATTDVLRDCPPHEMSCLTIEKLYYGESRAQESAPPRPHVPPAIAARSTFFLRDVDRAMRSKAGA